MISTLVLVLVELSKYLTEMSVFTFSVHLILTRIISVFTFRLLCLCTCKILYSFTTDEDHCSVAEMFGSTTKLTASVRAQK